jgi:tetratricopeptide (TPR) repeat protein
MINMGVALQREGRHKDAVEAYRKGLAIDPNWPEAHLNQAYALQDMGLHQQAGDAFISALKVRPNTHVYTYITHAYIRMYVYTYIHTYV